MSTVQAPERWDDARAHVLPLLRRVTEPAQAWYAAMADRGNELVSRPVAPFLHQLVVLDLPLARIFVSRSHLDVWRVPADAVYQAAHRNLTDLATAGLHRRPQYGGLWQISSEDRYESSRLLLSGFLGAFADQVVGTPVAAIPAGRVVLIGGSESEDQIATLAELAERAFRSADAPLSPVLYTEGPSAGTLRPWAPPPEHPLHARIAGLSSLLGAHEYEAQRDQMDGNPVIRSHVAEVTLTRGFDGVAETSARWDKAHGETLLPVVDRVTMIDGDAELDVPWGVLWAEARGCLVSTTLSPERFRARWPLDATLSRLRIAST